MATVSVAMTTFALLWLCLQCQSASLTIRELRKIDELIENYLDADYRDVKKPGLEEEAEQWVNQYNVNLRRHMNADEVADWAYLTNINNQTASHKEDVSVATQTWIKDQVVTAKQYNQHAPHFRNKTLVRMLNIIARLSSDPVPEDDQQLKEQEKLKSLLTTLYASHQTPNLSEHGNNYTYMKSAWEYWYDVTGKDMRAPFAKVVKIQNEASKENDFADYGQYVRYGDFDEDDIEEIADDLWRLLKPLYLELHAYIRWKLHDIFPDVVDLNGPIPLPLTGNMYGQEWYIPNASPYPDVAAPSITDTMLAQNWTTTGIFKAAETFFTSLGLEPMTQDFWSRSMLVQPPNKTVDCWPSSEDFSTDQDFRIKMCTTVDEDNLYTVHHEMGHIEYFMQYRHQPTIYREGANAAFHEAIGDTIALSVMTPVHLRRMGLMAPDESDADKQNVNFLMRMALTKVVLLPWTLLVDKWRFRVYRGEIDPTDYNREWWKLVREYQGLIPPAPRDESGFDPGAKFHVASFTPYLRYFLAGIGEFQFHQALCAEAGQEELNNCDIYGSKKAGSKLKSMLSLGASKPWRQAMKLMTGRTEFETDAILEYFRPLYHWLRSFNKKHGVKVGWD